MLFLDILEKGLVYRKKSKVNWDPVDNTVLANEQVIDGRGWRSGALVEQRELTQWFFKITDFSQDLLDALDTLDQWPEKVRLMQKNWIGRSEGLTIRWEIVPETAPNDETRNQLSIRRGPTRCSAPLSWRFPPIIRSPRKQLPGMPDIDAFCEECRRAGTSLAALETAEKKGMDTGIRVRHPLDPVLGAAGLRRQFRADGLWHGRDLRLPVRRPARPRFRPQIRPAGRARRDAEGWRRRKLHHRRRSPMTATAS